MAWWQSRRGRTIGCLLSAFAGTCNGIWYPQCGLSIHINGGDSYPVQQAAEIAVQTVRSAVQEHPRAFDEILWVLFDERTKLVYDGKLQEQI